MKPACVEILDRARVRVSGADAARYLNGQLSNDLRKLPPGAALRACLLTAKGKLVADPFVWREGEDFILEAHASLQEALLARLERYIVADDVTVEPLEVVPATYHVLGVAEPAGRAINRLGVPGFDAAEPPAGIPRLDFADAETIRIRHAMPLWGKELDADVLPAEAGLDVLAVDFHKGCYVGQEVVSRMETAGRTRRQLAVLQTRPLLPEGTELFAPGGEHAIGRLTSSTPEAGGGVALAWLTPAFAAAGTRLKPAAGESDSLTDIEVIEKLP
ncbi:MAG TPA: hypothetical protein VIS74_02685 [Chthoniobacterales bacterium]